MDSVTFPNRGVELAADLHLPADFDPSGRSPAVVCVHPGSSVKEQTSGLYAARLAEHGYVALAYDASYQGDSGGEPRHLEDPAVRVEDVRCAVDFLVTQRFVDEDRIGVVGVCAGGGYAVNAALTDHRIAAVGVVSPINIGRARREGGDAIALLEAAGRRRTAQARGEEPAIDPWTPESAQAAAAAGLTDADLLEAVDYYRTPRGAHPRSDNRLLASSAAHVLGFDAFHLVERLLTQPLQVVVGDRVGSFGSYRDGYELFGRAASDAKDLLVVPGAGHYDLYDRPEPVGLAVERLVSFFGAHLTAAAVPA